MVEPLARLSMKTASLLLATLMVLGAPMVVAAPACSAEAVVLASPTDPARYVADDGSIWEEANDLEGLQRESCWSNGQYHAADLPVVVEAPELEEQLCAIRQVPRAVCLTWP